VISKEKFFPLRVPSGLPSSSGAAASAAAASAAGPGHGGTAGQQGATTSSGTAGGRSSGGGGAGSVASDGEGGHPEGPNIGFGSDPSWLAKARAYHERSANIHMVTL
jgi:hypothetical protein